MSGSVGGEVPPDAAQPPAAAPNLDDRLAASLRGFGPPGILAMLVIVFTGNIAIAPMLYAPVSALLVLLWARLSGTPWREIGYVRPRSWIATAALGIGLGVSFKLVMKALVMPMLGADPVNHAYHFLTGNRALLPTAIYAMLNAGFAEETVFRGYAFERLGKLLGNGPWSRAGMVLATSAWFGAAHLHDQGLSGAEQAAIVGLGLGTIYAFTRRLPLLMITHAAFDLTALTIIYFGLESRVAHWVLWSP
jgi:membrane protease YdiL (CAAX protease family)